MAEDTPMKQKTEQTQAEKADKEMEDNRARSRSQRAAREKVNEEKRKKKKEKTKKMKEKDNEEKLKKETLKKESKKTKKKKRKLEIHGKEKSNKRRKEGENSPTFQDSSPRYAESSSASSLQLVLQQPGAWETYFTKIFGQASLYIEILEVSALFLVGDDNPVKGTLINVGMTSRDSDAYSDARRYTSPGKQTLYFLELPANLTRREVLVLDFALRKYLEEPST
jgi:hypothetical protein